MNILKNVFRNQSGFTLAEVIVTAGVASIFIMSSYMVIYNMQNFQKRYTKISSGVKIKNHLLSKILNNHAWKKTMEAIENQTLFNCLNSDTGCIDAQGAGYEGPINVIANSNVDQAGNPYFYVPSRSAEGFTVDGDVCTGFNSQTGNENCPIHVDLYGQFKCAVRNVEVNGVIEQKVCNSPQLFISAKFIYKGDPSKPSIPMGKFNFHIYKNIDKTNLGDCTFGCRSETFTYDPNAVDQQDINRPTLKVLFIVDNSLSMEANQARLATGVDTMLDKFKGLNTDIKFYVYTTSQWGAGRVTSEAWTCQYTDQLGTVKVVNGNCPDPLNTWGVNEATRTIKYNLLDPSATKAGQLQLPSTFTDNQYASLKQTLLDAIANAGTNGAQEERGSCTIARALYDDALSVFKEGDKAVIVIISDEQDTSVGINNCLKERVDKISCSESYGTRPVKCTGADCDFYKYISKSTDIYQYRTKVYCSREYNNDGTTASYRTGGWRYSNFIADTLSCTAYSPNESVDCIGSDIDVAKALCAGAGLSFTDTSYCKYSCTEKNTITRDVASGTNACTDPDANGKTLIDDFTETYPTATAPLCELQSGYNTIAQCRWTNFIKRVQFADLNPDNSTNTLQEAIVDKAKSLFGDNGFFISSIIHDTIANADAGGCVPNANQSWGTNYSSLVKATNGDIASICAEDYSPALDKIQAFAHLAIASSYTITLGPNERIVRVQVKNSDTGMRDLLVPDEVSINGDTIQFVEGAVQPLDEVFVVVENFVGDRSVSMDTVGTSN